MDIVPNNVFCCFCVHINIEIVITCRMETNAYKIAHEVFLQYDDKYEYEEIF